jgi:tRNA 2-thiouridine synthesizing protein E
MPTTILEGTTVDVSDEGFFTRPEAWTEGMAPEIAAREGIDQLTEQHWQIIKFMRERYLNKERPPTIRLLSKHFDISIWQLYRMFPKSPIKLAAKIGGVPEPRSHLGGCVVNWA